jgi:hypothetical protein
MANNYYFKINKGVSFTPQTTIPTNAKKGDLYYDDALNLLQAYDGTSWSNVGGGGAVLTIGTGLNGSSYDGTSAVTIEIDSTVVTLTGSQVLTNKTLTSPVINTQTADTITGISGGDLTLNSPSSYSILLKNNSNTQATISSTGIDLASGKALKLANNSQIITLQASATASASYSVIFPDASPGANTYLSYNGIDYIWSSGGWSVSTQTIISDGTITIDTTVSQQVVRISGSGGPITANVLPFSSVTPLNGACIRLMGTSDTNTVTISNNNAIKGCILNGTAILGQYDMIELQYNSTDNRYVEVSRNF